MAFSSLIHTGLEAITQSRHLNLQHHLVFAGKPNTDDFVTRNTRIGRRTVKNAGEKDSHYGEFTCRLCMSAETGVKRDADWEMSFADGFSVIRSYSACF